METMEGFHLVRRRIGPPALQTKLDMNPTLLVSWFCTVMSLICILIRLLGRWVRTERLFREDKVMFWSIIPLISRMGFVHMILIWGTNNTVTAGLTDVEIYQRSIGSRLVLPARLLYAIYIWTAKITVLEFLQRLIGKSWIKSYEIGMRIIYGLLGFTFVGVVISTLAECQPFHHYWQVVPDPGAHCRAGIAQLVTMGACDIVTDLVLMLFPIPLVFMSAMRMKRKFSLMVLFLLSLVPLAITAYRIPSTISRGASQQYRSLLASIEILAATGVANAIVIGSFVRDRGVKKARFRAASIDGSIASRQRTRAMSVAINYWGSDEDLVRDFGISVDPQLRHASAAGNVPRPAPIALTNLPPESATRSSRRATVDANWSFVQSTNRHRGSLGSESASSTSTDLKAKHVGGPHEEPPSPTTKSQPQMSFFDVGGLIDDPRKAARVSNEHPPHSSQTGTNLFISDVGGLLGSPTPTRMNNEGEGSRTRPANIGMGHSTPHREELKQFLRSASPFRKGNSSPRVRPKSQLFSNSPRAAPLAPDAGPDDLDITDVGGLLR